nr:DUF4438 domain-containing protein [Leifsonia naganoensis]
MVAYRIDEDGHPYVPLGDGGIVLGVELGDPAFATAGDHVAAGVSLVHPDPGARFALTAFACVGNEAVVLSGAAAGRRGRVIGKRGESGRVLVGFDDDVMRALLPGDRVSVRSVGQGFQPLGVDPAIEVLSLDPALYDLLPITTDDGITSVTTVTTLPSRVCGNGIGRPAQMWDVDLAVSEGSPLLEGVDLRLGDLVAISDLDVRHNMGFRRGWLTVGVIGHGGSPMPGHGPGLVPLITGPSSVLRAVAADPGSPRPALTDALLAALDGRDA